VSLRTLTHAKRAFVSAHVEILILVLLYENGQVHQIFNIPVFFGLVLLLLQTQRLLSIPNQLALRRAVLSAPNSFRFCLGQRVFEHNELHRLSSFLLTPSKNLSPPIKTSPSHTKTKSSNSTFEHTKICFKFPRRIRFRNSAKLLTSQHDLSVYPHLLLSKIDLSFSSTFSIFAISPTSR